MQAPTSQQNEEERFSGSAIDSISSSTEKAPVTEAGDISGLEADKKALEQATEGTNITTADGQIFKTLRALPAEPQGPMPTETQVESAGQDKIVKEIEQIMSADLAQIDPKTKQLTGLFTEIPPDRQALLKQEGERIAREFDAMIKSGKLDLQEVHNDVEQWLRIIPTVNKPWLAQQATIITDKIANIHQEYIRDINPN